jgi:hypothetical protein
MSIEPEDDRLRKVAEDYRARGYEVKIQPRREDLPDFLSSFEPDLIASGKGETLVVEVKTRRELSSHPSPQALEAALQNRPGWRFELIIDAADAELRETLTLDQIRSLLETAKELQRPAFSVAALLTLWSATEGALRLLAQREHVDLESLAPAYVVNKLYTVGLLGRDQLQALREAMRLRNQAAHGFQVAINSEDLIRLFEVLQELLNEVDMKAA